MRIWPGTPYPLGATWDGRGTNFALFSEVAGAVELCLFDDDGTESRIGLREVDAFVWHGYVPGVCAVTSILELISRPGNPGPPERLAHRLVQPLAYRHLVTVGATVIPETFDVEDDNRAVNGSSLTHFAHLRKSPTGMVQGLRTDDYRKLLHPNRPARQGKLALPASQNRYDIHLPEQGQVHLRT